MQKYKYIWGIFFVIVMILSMCTILYCTYYDVLTQHDLAVSFGRKLLYPEHGRYLATFTNNILTERLPEIFNIHPNDFQQYFINPYKGILVIFSCLYITNGFFLFSKKEDNIFKLPICNPVFIFSYIVIFLLLFNNDYFFKYPRMYYGIFENTVFFEYPMSIILYVLFMSLFIYHFVNNIKPNKINYILLLILSFWSGISVEPVNIPLFGNLFFLSVYLISKLICSRKNQEKFNEIKQNYKWMLPIFIVYIVSISCYLIKPSYHHIFFMQYSFKEYLKYASGSFLFGYYNEFIGYSSLLVIPILIVMYIIYFKSKKDVVYNEKIKRLILIVLISLFCFLLYYAATFFIGYLGIRFAFELEKWKSIYKVILLAYLLIIISSYLDIKLNEKANKIKFILCIIVLLIFNNSLIINYADNINQTREQCKELRTAVYKAEKYATRLNYDDILLPKYFKNYEENLWFQDAYTNYECGFVKYINNVHPKIDKEYARYSDDVIDEVTFTDEELKKLKFQNLLLEKMYRHKKTFNCLS